MPGGLHHLLPAAGFRLSDGRRYRARGAVFGHDGPGVRETIRLPHTQPAPAADTARVAVPVFAGGWMRDPSGKAHAVPAVSVLAGADGEIARVAADVGMVSGNWQRRAGADRNSAKAGWGDARGLPLAVSIESIGRTHGEELQRLDGAGNSGAGHIARRGRRPHLWRLRGWIAGGVSGDRPDV